MSQLLPEKDGVTYIRVGKDPKLAWWTSVHFFQDFSEILIKHRRRRANRQSKSEDEPQKTDFEATYLDFWDSMLSFLTGSNFLQEHGRMLSGMLFGHEIRALLDSQSIEKIRERGPYTYYAVREATLEDVLKILRKDNETGRFTEDLPTLLVPALMAAFDSFVMRTISNVLQKRPEIARSIKKQISLTELLDFPSIEVARAALIEKEIESVMRDSHEAHINWISQVLKVPLEPEGDLKAEFFELCERRNIITHNGGRINRIYLENCEKYGLSTDGKIEGSVLRTDAIYLMRSVACVIDMATKISQVVWRKVDPSTKERAEKTINDVSYELIKREQYELAIRLFEFCRTDFKSWASDTCRLQNLINHANALRLSGRGEEACKLLDDESWEAKSIEYKICVAAVKEDHIEVVSLLRANAANMPIRDYEFLQWPVFRGIRETKEFRLAFKDVFGWDALGAEEGES